MIALEAPGTGTVTYPTSYLHPGWYRYEYLLLRVARHACPICGDSYYVLSSALAEFGYMYHWGGTCTTKALDLNLSNTGIVPDQPT